MHKQLSACVLGAVLAGCAIGPAPQRAPVDAGAGLVFPENVDRDVGTALLGYVADLDALPESGRLDELERARRAFRVERSTANALRLALVIRAIPGTSRGREAVAALRAAEPALASIIDGPLAMHVVPARLETENAALKKRIASLDSSRVQAEAESAHAIESLSTALDQAEAKIRALTSIEEEIKRTEGGVIP